MPEPQLLSPKFTFEIPLIDDKMFESDKNLIHLKICHFLPPINKNTLSLAVGVCGYEIKMYIKSGAKIKQRATVFNDDKCEIYYNQFN